MEVKPVGRQREVLYLPAEGHYVVLGPAGSGKSTMAVLRSRYLADSDLEHGGRVLLVTYTKALTKYLAQLAGTVGPSVDVCTLHGIGKEALKPTGARALYYPQKMNQLQNRAISRFKESDPEHPLASRSSMFFIDEFAWIAGHGITDKFEYLEAERTGRGLARILRAHREALFDVYVHYLEIRQEAGYDYDLQDVSHQLHLALRQNKTSLPYRHVVIDEAQDFSPEVMRAAGQMVPPGGSVTVFADYAQQVYGRSLSWKSAGLKIRKIWQLKGNYRNTKQITAIAEAIAQQHDLEAGELLHIAPGYGDGPVPLMVPCATTDEEHRRIAELVRDFAPQGSVAVLARTWDSLASLADQYLPNEAMKLHRDLESLVLDGIYYGTLHGAKGFDFDSVLIVKCDRTHLPDPKTTEAHGVEEARSLDLRLLYIGVTRARTNLAFSYTGSKSQLLPSDSRLFKVQP